MELQTGGIIVVIIITLFVLISYAIYLIYSENRELKGKINVMNSSLENVQNNFTTFSNAVNNQFQKSQITEDEEEESDIEEESETESDIEEQEQMILKSLGLNNSIDLFNHSSEELEDLKKFQNKIQGTKIKEIETIESEDEESEDDESDHEDNTKEQDNEHNEDHEDNEHNEDQSKLSITINGDLNCSKKLTRGKNVGKICERKVVADSEFCSLHQA